MSDNGAMKKAPKNEKQVVELRREMYERIEESLRAIGLSTSQEKIGRLLVPEVTQGAVSQWKSGATTPNPDFVTQIALRTGRCFEWLWTGRGPKYPDTEPLNIDDVIVSFLDSLSDQDRGRIIQRVQDLDGS